MSEKTLVDIMSDQKNSVFTYLQLKKCGIPEQWIEYILKSPIEQTERFQKYHARTEEKDAKRRARQDR